MIKKILSLTLLIFLMAFALVAYSVTSSPPNAPDVSGTVANYKQQVVAKTRKIAEPILQRAGIDVEKVNVEDANIVQQQMEEAAKKLDEANKILSQ